MKTTRATTKPGSFGYSVKLEIDEITTPGMAALIEYLNAGEEGKTKPDKRPKGTGTVR